MIMAMTATPLAMLGCGLSASDVGPVIQWHVVGMFAPSFFTGTLITRCGAPRIMQIGFVLLLGHVAVAVAGLEWLHFLSALILLGVGWNFAFIGGTALLTQTYRACEQTRCRRSTNRSSSGSSRWPAWARVGSTTASAGACSISRRCRCWSSP